VLFGALAVQLLFAVSRTDGLAVCSACGSPYCPPRKPRIDQRHYCSGYRRRGAWRDAQRARRAVLKMSGGTTPLDTTKRILLLKGITVGLNNAGVNCTNGRSGSVAELGAGAGRPPATGLLAPDAVGFTNPATIGPRQADLSRLIRGPGFNCEHERAQLAQILELFGEDSWGSVHAGELEVRPPGAPTTTRRAVERSEAVG
jgi:hypothetical protein